MAGAMGSLLLVLAKPRHVRMHLLVIPLMCSAVAFSLTVSQQVQAVWPHVHSAQVTLALKPLVLF